MKFNPCGMVLDYLPCCYETVMRPFRDSEETVGWRWFPALPTAKVHPAFHFLTSSNWLDFHDETIELGQRFYTDRVNRFIPPVPEALGQKYCGPIDYFTDGQPYDPSVQPTVYNENGIPACCLDVMQGRIGGEGSPAALLHGSPKFYGRIGGEGSPWAVVNGPPKYSGRIGGEGSPAAVVNDTYHTFSLVGGEGSPAAMLIPPYLHVGLVGGEGSPRAMKNSAYHVVGLVGGEGVPAALATPPYSHLGRVGGEGVPWSRTNGRVTILGRVGGEGCPAQATAPVYVDPAAGGLEIGGAAGDMYTPGGVVPGTDCLTAWEADIGETIGFGVGAGASAWFKINLEAATVYHIDITGVTGDVTLAMAYSLDCDVFNPVTYSTPHAGCRQWTTPSAVRMVFWFTAPTAGATCSFTVSAGPCT